MSKVRMLAKFSFPQFLQAENNPHSAATLVDVDRAGMIAMHGDGAWHLHLGLDVAKCHES